MGAADREAHRLMVQSIGQIPTDAGGVLFLLLAARAWRNRSEQGDEPELLAWMAGIERFTACCTMAP